MLSDYALHLINARKALNKAEGHAIEHQNDDAIDRVNDALTELRLMRHALEINRNSLVVQTQTGDDHSSLAHESDRLSVQ
jgi:hypothetical protein